MSNETKTAIHLAEKMLEKERSEKLKNEVYLYLKGELEAVDSIDGKIRKLQEEKRAHEENIKNIKQGNLSAIEQRRQAFDWTVVPYRPDWPVLTSGYMISTATGSGFYSMTVAGTTIQTAAGNTYIF